MLGSFLAFVSPPGDVNEDVSKTLEAQSALSERTELSAERSTPTKVTHGTGRSQYLFEAFKQFLLQCSPCSPEPLSPACLLVPFSSYCLAVCF